MKTLEELTDPKKMLPGFFTIPFKYWVTPTQYKNAKTHWEKLMARDISKEFNMEYYCRGNSNEPGIISINSCGTSACSAGYIPETLGLSVKQLKPFATGTFGELSYSRLAAKYLGIFIRYPGVEPGKLIEMAWEWVFAAEWAYTDNTPEGAGIRMRILLEQGLPFNHYQNVRGWHDSYELYREEAELLIEANNKRLANEKR